MLRRKPTAITLTSEDVANYEDYKAASKIAADRRENNANSFQQSASQSGGTAVAVDPNDELKPLPGDKARIVRTPGAGLSREERIGMGR